MSDRAVNPQDSDSPVTLRVMKFGGTSLANAARVDRAASLVADAYAMGRVVVVASALGGVTDDLSGLADEAAKGDDAYARRLESLSERHVCLAEAVSLAGERTRVEGRIAGLIQDLTTVAAAVHRVQDCSALRRDFILSFGERLSAVILAAAVRSRGLTSDDHDSRRFFITDQSFGEARVILAETEPRVQAYFRRIDGAPVVTGYIGSTRDGDTTTLGRNSSDLSAAVLAAALDASLLELWTDVDGIMTADPRIVRDAISLTQVGYEEVNELSRCGAKVVFPHTIQTVLARGIPILVRNTLNPAFPGTVIGREGSRGTKVLGVTSTNSLELITVVRARSLDGAEHLDRVRTALGRAGVPALALVPGAAGVSAALPQAMAARALVELEDVFGAELASGVVSITSAPQRMSIVTVVTGGQSHQPDVAAAVRRCVEESGLNVVAEAGDERAIRLVVPADREHESVRALHECLFGGARRFADVFVCGVGNVGAEVVSLLTEMGTRADATLRVRPVLRAFCNSRRTVLLDGSSGRSAKELLESGLEGTGALHDECRKSSRSVFVDCTSSPDVAASYADILAAGTPIVTANKLLLSGPLEQYRGALRAGARSGAALFYEATVGAGLPVIGTLRSLVSSGDRVVSIEGCLSGTLSYLTSALMAGVGFSDAVAKAHALGFTEPDPRADLSGMDVARKLVILARESGFTLSLQDVQLDGLLPEALQASDLEAFWTQLPAMNDRFETRVAEAARKASRLVYLARYRDGVASVGLESVDAAHPAFGLAPSENLFVITTHAYREVPLVIRGPGAGPRVTALGVMGDIINAALLR